MFLRRVITTLCLTISSSMAGQMVIVLEDTVQVGAIGQVADRMIVAFDETAPIGVVYQAGVPVNIFLDLPVGQSLMNALHRPGPISENPEREVILKLGQLRLLQVGVGLQLGMHLEFLERTPTGYLRLHAHGTSINSNKSGRNDIAAIVTQAFEECLTSYGAIASAHVEGVVVDSLMAHAPMEVHTTELPVWNVGQGPSGVYHTYLDMAQNRPDTLDIKMREKVRSLYTDQLVKLRHVDRNTREAIWGFTDGTHIYKNLGNEFVRLVRNDDHYCARWQAPTQTDATALLVGGALGGVMGVLIADGLTRTQGEVINYALDPLSGDLWPVKERDKRPGLPSLHVLHFSRYAKGDTTVLVGLEEGPAITLRERQWTVLRPEPRLANAFATIRSPDGQTLRVAMDTNTKRTEVYLIDMKADGSISMKQLSEQMAHKTIERLKKEERR